MHAIEGETERCDKAQRRAEYEAACIAEKEYYERQELGCVSKTLHGIRLKPAAVCAPSNVSYLRRNRWIQGVDKYFTRK
jgi:hypothetical protein